MVRIALAIVAIVPATTINGRVGFLFDIGLSVILLFLFYAGARTKAFFAAADLHVSRVTMSSAATGLGVAIAPRRHRRMFVHGDRPSAMMRRLSQHRGSPTG